MKNLDIELGPIRPVAEARSLLIRTTRGCPWNKCDFCVNYKQMKFSIRSLEEIKSDIIKAADYYHKYNFESCFLQDGDSFIMKTKDLLEILQFLKKYFPSLKRITSYGRASTMVSKSLEEMKELREAGLNRLYCGMESGSEKVLTFVNKGTTPSKLIKAGCMAKEAGMEISEFIILGLGGRSLSEEHARETADVLNQIDPDFIRIRSIGVKSGSPLEQKMLNGEYKLQSEEELVLEQKMLLKGLNGVTGYYSNDHAVNLLMEVEGRLPQDKERMLAVLEKYLKLSESEKINFNIGRRIGYYRSLDDMEELELKKIIEEKVREMGKKYSGQNDEVCHFLRERII